MHIALLEITGWIPMSTSLKDKRRIIQSSLDKIKRQYNLSVAEVEYQDDRQRVGLAFVGVGNSKQLLEKECHQVTAYYEDLDGFMVQHVELSFV